MSSRRAAAILVTVALLAAAYMLGLISGHRALFPSQQILDAARDLRAALVRSDSGVERTLESRDIWTTFVPLHLQEIQVPQGRDGAGGGLTTAGHEVLLLTHDGRIFVIAGTDVSPSSISPPDNGFAGYARSAQGPASHLTHELTTFRYNDILYYSAAGASGLVLSYTEWVDERDCYCTTVAHLSLDPGMTSVAGVSADAEDWDIVFRTRPCLPLKEIRRAIEGHMAGGRMAFLPPDKVILGSGDYHWDGMYAPAAHAQIPANDYGKILEIDINDGSARQLAVGNRNVQGILVDRAAQIWAVEHGPRGGDELNRILAGGNYGWPLTTLGTQYDKRPIPSAMAYGRHEGFEPPVYAWLPSIGVSNLTQIDGFDPAWDGDLLVASLGARTLYRLRLEDNRVRFAEPIKLHRRIRYAHQHTDGRLVLWTDAGTLIFVEKSDLTPETEIIAGLIDDMDISAARKKVLTTALDGCSECHSYVPNDDVTAPSLGGVFDRAIASSGYSGYSQGLRAVSGRWGSDQLARFLKAPDEFAPGTTMPNPYLSDETIADVTSVLREL